MLDFPPQRIGAIVTKIVFRSATAWELAAIPMFVWMGEMMFRTDISERLFRGLAPLVDGIAGRLLHTNVMGCTLFAAVSGSSAATTATVGKITTTELARRELRHRARDRLARRRGLARPADPALDRDDHLRRAGRGLDRQAVRGRRVPGPDHRRRCIPATSRSAARCSRSWRRRAGERFTWRDRLSGLAQPAAGAVPDR